MYKRQHPDLLAQAVACILEDGYFEATDMNPNKKASDTVMETSPHKVLRQEESSKPQLPLFPSKHIINTSFSAYLASMPDGWEHCPGESDLEDEEDYDANATVNNPPPDDIEFHSPSDSVQSPDAGHLPPGKARNARSNITSHTHNNCLLYTSDAADE